MEFLALMIASFIAVQEIHVPYLTAYLPVTYHIQIPPNG
jgi:hypothetical protein